MFSHKPNNWYNMSYDERREWQRQDRIREDLEWEKDRAQQEASQAQDAAYSARQALRREMASAAEEAGMLQEELGIAQGERDTYKQLLSSLLAWIDHARAQEDERQHMPDDTYLQPIRDALAGV